MEPASPAAKRPAVKRRAVIWFCIALISFTATLLIPYLEGRTNSLWLLPPIIPASFFFLFMLVVSCVVLNICCVQSLRSRQHFMSVIAMFLFSLALLLVKFTIPEIKFFRPGFRHYAQTVLTPDEWRSIARFAQEHLPADGRLAGPRRSSGDPKDKKLWDDFVAATPIRKLDSSFVVFAHPDRTSIVWGGALAGHRSVSIFTSTNGIDRSTTRMSEFITEDIRISFSAD